MTFHLTFSWSIFCFPCHVWKLLKLSCMTSAGWNIEHHHALASSGYNFQRNDHTSQNGAEVTLANNPYHFKHIDMPTKIDITGSKNKINIFGGSSKHCRNAWEWAKLMLMSLKSSSKVTSIRSSLDTKLLSLLPDKRHVSSCFTFILSTSRLLTCYIFYQFIVLSDEGVS